MSPGILTQVPITERQCRARQSSASTVLITDADLNPCRGNGFLYLLEFAILQTSLDTLVKIYG